MTSGERSDEPHGPWRWRNGTTPVIGLTGGVASGKSAVAALLAERGCSAIDADSVGHAVLDLPEVKQKLVQCFGPQVVLDHGPGTTCGPRVDRRALAAIVFPDQEARRALEAIVHPLMRARFKEAIDLSLQSGSGPVILDAAILLEAGWQDLCDIVVFVDSTRAERFQRAADHRGWSEAVFDSRERAQWPCEEKRRHADYVIRNDGSRDLLRREVEALVQALRPGAAGPVPSPDAEARLGAILQAPTRGGPNVNLRCSPAEPATTSSRARAVDSPPAVPSAPVRNREDGSGTEAWRGSCFVM
jgi:dephospho-CoA kinase